MSARVFVRDDFMRDGVQIAARIRDGQVMRWGEVTIDTVPDNANLPDDALLHLPADVARALFDALAAHYGAGTDLAGLRKDYDAERSRVDKFITHLTQGPS